MFILFTKSSHILVKKSRIQINIKNQQSGNTAKILKGRTELNIVTVKT